MKSIIDFFKNLFGFEVKEKVESINGQPLPKSVKSIRNKEVRQAVIEALSIPDGVGIIKYLADKINNDDKTVKYLSNVLNAVEKLSPEDLYYLAANYVEFMREKTIEIVGLVEKYGEGFGSIQKTKIEFILYRFGIEKFLPLLAEKYCKDKGYDSYDLVDGTIGLMCSLERHFRADDILSYFISDEGKKHWDKAQADGWEKYISKLKEHGY